MSNEKKATPKENEKESVKLTPKQLSQLYRTERRKAIMLQKQLQGLEGMLLETIGARQVMEEVKNGQAEEVMVPLGAGLFMAASRKKDALILKSMAGNVMMPVNAEGMIAELHKNEETIRKQIEQAQKNQQEAFTNVSQLENAMALVSQRQQQTPASAAKK